MTTPLPLPPGACDCHMHFYAPSDSAGPITVGGLGLPPGDVETYRSLWTRLGLTRFVAVQSIFHGFDNRAMLEAVSQFGAAARAVVVLPLEVSTAELHACAARGARGLRAYMLLGSTYGWQDIIPLAKMAAGLDWHLQLQFDGRMLPEVEDLLRSLPCPLVIEHVGKFLDPVPIDHPAFSSLLKLLDTGSVWVKLSAPYESSRDGPPDFADVSRLARRLTAHAPHRMLWATNFPHPGQVTRPDEAHLLELLSDWSGDARTRDRILVDNPATLYGFPVS